MTTADTWECPNCGADQPGRERAMPCSECGQQSSQDAREAALFAALRELSRKCNARGRRILFAYYAHTL